MAPAVEATAEAEEGECSAMAEVELADSAVKWDEAAAAED